MELRPIIQLFQSLVIKIFPFYCQGSIIKATDFLIIYLSPLVLKFSLIKPSCREINLQISLQLVVVLVKIYCLIQVKYIIQSLQLFDKSLMEPNKVNLNGSIIEGKGNYIWAGALTLAWQQLTKQIVKEEIKIQSQNEKALEIVNNFNSSPFTTDDLSEECYYVCAGYGNNAVKKINKEVKKKFPLKSFQPLKQNVSDLSIIAYAYFFKQLLFKFPFKKQKLTFNEKRVSGFVGVTQEQKKQIIVYNYQNQNNFLVQLETVDKNNEILLLKSQITYKAEEVVSIVNESSKNLPLSKRDTFKMPCVQIFHKRNVEQLKGKKIKVQNEEFNGRSLDEIYEIIKLQINEKGVLLQNEGVIKSKGCTKILPQIRKIILDKPFWVIMRETPKIMKEKKHPYLLAYINQVK